jgi:hypothetical protein
MNLLNEQLARAQCRDVLAASRAERLARRALLQRRADRLARRASRLAQRASAWREVPAATA